MPEKKKTPADYPQFAFRLSAKQKNCLKASLESVYESLNSQTSDDEKVYTRNKILVAALEIGLSSIKNLRLQLDKETHRKKR